ncbi:MAG: hypothetical protein K940chlam5_01032 [Candidatus Anoxychlamydiales bacterium]|nr:hypothetical protein [Candidatus Anoxychlamydiales bacterium]
MKKSIPTSFHLASYFEDLLKESETILSSTEIQELTKFFKKALDTSDKEIDKIIDELLERLI